MMHASLLDLRVRHSWSANGVCRFVRCLPTLDAQEALRRQRLVLKSAVDGVRVLGEVHGGAEPPGVLRFWLAFDDPRFFDLTDLPAPTSGSIPCWRVSTGGQSLRAAPVGTPRPTAQEVFGLLEVEMPTDDNPVRYLDLEAASFPWAFYVLSDRAGSTAYSIRSSASPGGGPLFDPCEQVAEGASADPVGRGLLARNRGVRLFRLPSRSAVGASEVAPRMELLLDEEVLLPTLPCPSSLGLGPEGVGAVRFHVVNLAKNRPQGPASTHRGVISL